MVVIDDWYCDHIQESNGLELQLALSFDFVIFICDLHLKWYD